VPPDSPPNSPPPDTGTKRKAPDGENEHVKTEENDSDDELGALQVMFSSLFNKGDLV
jgi:hypothetical protein